MLKQIQAIEKHIYMNYVKKLNLQFCNKINFGFSVRRCTKSYVIRTVGVTNLVLKCAGRKKKV